MGNQYTCSDLYTCCDCGGEGCGCPSCFSCNACCYCLSGAGDHCEQISDEEFARISIKGASK